MRPSTIRKVSLRTAATSVFALVLVALPIADAGAAELQVLAGGGMTAPLKEIAANFERTTGHRLVIRFGTTPELIKLATTGGSFDLGVVPREVFNDASAKARFVAGPTTDIARVGLGVAVRKGVVKPDVGTPDALKQTLLKASSIASIPNSAAGNQVQRAYDLLGIGDVMKAKTKAQPTTTALVEAVEKGDAELGVFLLTTLTAPGLDIAGPFPAEVQQEVIFTASIAADTKEAEAAKAFIAYLMSPDAIAVMKARGMTPG
jgi:molybdate transport system substrate-binding protein